MAKPDAQTSLSELPLWAVALGCLVLAAIFCWPVLASGSAFGIDDWDQQLFYAESARRTLVHYHQAPLWNPWYCGGSPLLANPSSTFLNPLFFFSVIFGVLAGAKIEVALHMALSMLGAYLFARRLGARGVAQLFAPVVFGLSSVYTLHLATGHTNWFALAYLPFAAMFTCGAIDSATEGDWRRAGREAIGAGVATALLLFCGNAYFFVYQCLFALGYGLLTAVEVRPFREAWRPLAGGAAVGALTFAFSTIKLVPMAGFLRSVQRYDVKDESGAALSTLWTALVGRDPSLTANQLPGMQWRWWEYGAYTGLVPLALAVLAIVVGRAKAWRLASVGIFFLLFSMGNDGLVWPLVRGLRGFEGLRVPARAIAYVVLAVACLAALGATWIAEKARARASRRIVEGVAAIVVALVVADFFLVTRPVLAESFVLPPLSAPDTPDAPFHQVRGRKLFQTHTRYTDHLDHALRNEGTVNCYDRLHLPIAAIAQADDKGVRDARYRAEAWIDGAAGVATMTSFTPNRVLIDVDAAGGGTLVVNQNFDAAWKARVSGQDAPILTHQGVLGVALPSDGQRAQVELSYVPSRLGALFTLCTGLFAIGWLVAAGRRRK